MALVADDIYKIYTSTPNFPGRSGTFSIMQQVGPPSHPAKHISFAIAASEYGLIAGILPVYLVPCVYQVIHKIFGLGHIWKVASIREPFPDPRS